MTNGDIVRAPKTPAMMGASAETAKTVYGNDKLERLSDEEMQEIALQYNSSASRINNMLYTLPMDGSIDHDNWVYAFRTASMIPGMLQKHHENSLEGGFWQYHLDANGQKCKKVTYGAKSQDGDGQETAWLLCKPRVLAEAYDNKLIRQAQEEEYRREATPYQKFLDDGDNYNVSIEGQRKLRA